MAVLKGYIKATISFKSDTQELINSLMYALHNIEPKEDWRNATPNYDYGHKSDMVHFSLLGVSPARADEIIKEVAFYFRGYDKRNPYSSLYNTILYKTGKDNYGNCLVSFASKAYKGFAPISQVRI